LGWGDEIIVTGVARRLQERNPRPVLVLDRLGRPRWHPAWEGNPRFARPGWKDPVQAVTNGPGARPYIERETFDRWIWREWICPVGEIRISDAERAPWANRAERVILEPNLTPKASPNKDWGWDRWSQAALLLQRAGHRVTQVGPAGIRRLAGAELVETRTFREACAVLSLAHLAILPEGGLHHAAAALGVPTVVIFGGFISPRQTGYAHQVNLCVGGEPCGMRRPCRHCADAMRRIDPELVIDRGAALLRARRSEPSSDSSRRLDERSLSYHAT
jgi:glycosyl transferase family 9 (putative heptosyltransferase)